MIRNFRGDEPEVRIRVRFSYRDVRNMTRVRVRDRVRLM
jgi:head-tail adaptor